MNLILMISQVMIIICVLLALYYNYRKEGRLGKFDYVIILCLILLVFCLIVKF